MTCVSSRENWLPKVFLLMMSLPLLPRVLHKSVFFSKNKTHTHRERTKFKKLIKIKMFIEIESVTTEDFQVNINSFYAKLYTVSVIQWYTFHRSLCLEIQLSYRRDTLNRKGWVECVYVCVHVHFLFLPMDIRSVLFFLLSSIVASNDVSAETMTESLV